MKERGYYRRRWINRFMLGLSGLAAGIAIIILVVILAYIIKQGISYINLDFFTNTFKPAGELGGGMRNEIIGTIILVAIASAIALPIGLMTGMYLSEFGSPRMISSVRFAAGILAGVPSIIVGVFAYGILVRPMHSYSALAAGVALSRPEKDLDGKIDGSG